MMKDRNNQVFAASSMIAIGLIASSIIGAWAFLRAKSSDQIVVVTGSARKRIRSDLIVWRTTVTAQSPQLSDAYRKLTESVPRVKAYLISKGIPEDQIVISSIKTETQQESKSDGSSTGRVIGYSLTQNLEMRSSEVDKITKISREVTELINQGILLESSPPEYHYTKLGDLKVEMLAEAAKDAKVRAQQIAANTGAEIGNVRAARMGVLQITPADSHDISGYGVNDITSLEKDITAVVNISFALD
jgi:hypothetical protein